MIDYIFSIHFRLLRSVRQKTVYASREKRILRCASRVGVRNCVALCYWTVTSWKCALGDGRCAGSAAIAKRVVGRRTQIPVSGAVSVSVSQAMEAFRRMFAYLDAFTGRNMDIIRMLPCEISNMIFNMLDGRTLRSVAMVSRPWRMRSVHERRRRLPRVEEHNLARCSPVECPASRIPTFVLNERNGSVHQEVPRQYCGYLRKSGNPKDKRGNANLYSRNNLRF